MLSLGVKIPIVLCVVEKSRRVVDGS